MSFLEKLRRKVSSSRYPSDYWPSVVVLLAQPQFPTREEILSRAQKAWGNAGPLNFLGASGEGTSHIIQCGPLTFSVHCANARYGQASEPGDDILQRPWHDHKAWMSVDLPKLRNEELYRSGSLAEMYKVLLVFVFLSWTNNCLAIYFPAEGATIPNFGDLAASINWGRQAGLSLGFLG